jgi:peptidoglycan/LPS O-acetylase OafA/YrhL
VATHVAFQTGRTGHGPFAATLARLDIGVALFFVLSGFLLFRPFAVAAATDRRRWPGSRDYLRRRALRILPAYWLTVVASLALLPDNAGQRGVAVWVRHLTLTQIYSQDLQRFGLTQAWSLCTEVAFYLLLPLLALLILGRSGGATGRRPLVVLALIAVISVAWPLGRARGSLLDLSAAGQWLPGYLDWFAAGMTLALVQVRLSVGTATRWMLRLRELACSAGTCWGLALGLFAIATSAIAGPRALEGYASVWQAVLKNLLYAACGLLVVLPLALGPQTGPGAVQTLGRRPLQLLGEISYGVFLWHLVVLEAVVRSLDSPLFHGSWLLIFGLTYSLSLLVATASYLLVERPCLRLKDRRGRPSGSAAAQTSARAMRQSA